MATPPVFTAGAQLTAAQMNAIGMWQITQSNMGTTTSVDNCFSSDFSFYRIIMSSNVTTTAGYTMRLRVGGSDNSTANYKWLYVDQNVAAGGTAAPISQSGYNVNEWYIGNSGNGGTGTAIAWIDVYNPYSSSAKTTYTFQTVFEWTSGTIYNRQGGGQFNGTTSFTGFSILAAATTTGTVTVYGWRPA